ncbi:hypothetical protein [uncultured Tateyamaria sp.]|uniref:hypothetical protein n=1 Tax=uncultured Tateyamaria sp. TaxID=455651 RepID=UPI002622323F|nr:hypothetical protein [uncultured Tateyamaria sp.]
MTEEIEILRSRTDEILVQVLSQWSQSVIVCQDRNLPPFGRLASCLASARDMLAEAAIAATQLETSEGEFFDDAFGDETDRTERHVSVDIEEHEVTTTGPKKGKRK